MVDPRRPFFRETADSVALRPIWSLKNHGFCRFDALLSEIIVSLQAKNKK